MAQLCMPLRMLGILPVFFFSCVPEPHSDRLSSPEDGVCRRSEGRCRVQQLLLELRFLCRSDIFLPGSFEFMSCKICSVSNGQLSER